MTRIILSIVSHGHSDLIIESNLHELLEIKDVRVIVKDNLVEHRLKLYCASNNIDYVKDCPYSGFGRNNNIVYSYYRDRYGLTSEDYFVCMNPDVVISCQQLRDLIAKLQTNDPEVFSIKLFKDIEFSVVDPAARRFPSFRDFVSSFVFGVNKTVLSDEELVNGVSPDWVAGSFIGFKSRFYHRLGGFDEKYFMYCEDIDICLRSKLAGVCIKFYADVKAQHLTAHQNRVVFSKHFLWHLKSVSRFLMKRTFFKLKGAIHLPEKL